MPCNFTVKYQPPLVTFRHNALNPLLKWHLCHSRKLLKVAKLSSKHNAKFLSL